MSSKVVNKPDPKTLLKHLTQNPKDVKTQKDIKPQKDIKNPKDFVKKPKDIKPQKDVDSKSNDDLKKDVKNNPFSLDRTKKNKMKRSKHFKDITLEQKQNLVKNYTKEPDHEKWKEIIPGTFIRPMLKNGEIMNGGFFKLITESDTPKIIMNSKLYGNIKNFVSYVPVEDVAFIFINKQTIEYAKTKIKNDAKSMGIDIEKTDKKFDIVVRALRNYNTKIDGLEASIKEQTETIEQLEKKVKTLESALGKVINLIKQHPEAFEQIKN